MHVLLPDPHDQALTGSFWGRMASVHQHEALAHQYAQLERAGAVEAFAIAAGQSDDFQRVDFTSDSDVHKWIEAAARGGAGNADHPLAAEFERLVLLLERAQRDDGYLNTWIQAHFPRGRFHHLETEHELYTLGHLIEAGVSHHEATGDQRLLSVSRRAADLLVNEFGATTADRVDGHQGIELALIRLGRHTGDGRYVELARRFVERRGTAASGRRRFAMTFLGTLVRLGRQATRRQVYRRAHPGWAPPRRAAPVEMGMTPRLTRQMVIEALNGTLCQTDRPARDLIEPTGHAVRYLYQHTAMAMLARDLDDHSLQASSVRAWERFVAGHAFVSGGAGAIPGVEGFAAPGDLDPERAYCETCAALGSVFWNRELGLLTGEPRFDDLLEWQLLNAAAVGMSTDGSSYFYRNPLQANPGFGRRPWYAIPCCPSNLTRTWMSLPSLQFSQIGSELRLHQFFSSRARVGSTVITVETGLPWFGDVVITLASSSNGKSVRPTSLRFRVPSWAGSVNVAIDGVAAAADLDIAPSRRPGASGLDPGQARWATVVLPDSPACEIRLDFELPIRLIRQHRAMPRVGGKVAVARGPLLFCLEGVDHPELSAADLTDVTLDPASLTAGFDPDLLGGSIEIRGSMLDGQTLRFVPYALWNNRGDTGMTAFTRAAADERIDQCSKPSTRATTDEPRDEPTPNR